MMREEEDDLVMGSGPDAVAGEAVHPTSLSLVSFPRK